MTVTVLEMRSGKYQLDKDTPDYILRQALLEGVDGKLIAIQYSKDGLCKEVDIAPEIRELLDHHV